MKKIFLFVVLCYFCACTKDKYAVTQPEASCYPDNIAKIINNKCAVSGCHNTQSAGNSNGLDYSSWETMFKGGKNGSSVIPYAPDLSYMLYFCNTDTNLGIVLKPTMPYLQEPLSRDEYLTLKDWINKGAPNCDGYVNFSDNPDRKKFYVCMQPCNKVAVFDAETRVIMRYISVGNGNGGCHQVKITPDGKYWCAVFRDGDILQVFRTNDDTEVAKISLGIGNPGQWNTVSFSSDSKAAYVADFSGGIISVVDLVSMSQVTFLGGMNSPHGTALSPGDTNLYITSQAGKQLYKMKLIDTLGNQYSIDQVNLGTNDSLNAHEIIFSPDGSRYYLTCQSLNQVQVFSTATDQWIASIPVGAYPQEFSISLKHHWLFVSCTEDVSCPDCSAERKGSVYIIDYTNNSYVTSLYPGFQPHGIAVDDDHDLVYVANLNYDTNGPAPHHVSDCGGRNGYVTAIDMTSKQLLNVTLTDGTQYQYKNEVLQYPYFVSYRK
jgi:DNA-binding beta-propeller fold protein YncE